MCADNLICDYPADIYTHKSGIHKHLCLPVTENLVLSELNAILVKNNFMLHKHYVYIILSMSPRTERKVSHKLCMLVLLVSSSSQKFNRLLWNGVCKLINDNTNVVACWDLV